MATSKATTTLSDFPREFLPNLNSLEEVYEKMEDYDHDIGHGDLVVVEPEDEDSNKHSMRACVDAVHRGVVYGYSVNDHGEIFSLYTDICVPATRVEVVGSMKLAGADRYFVDEETNEVFDSFRSESANKKKEYNLMRRV